MSQSTQVNDLVINKLTKEQYESITSPSDTELYLVTDDPGITSDEIAEVLGYTPQQELTAGDNITIKSQTGHDLPSGYTEVEYIESTGTQYIDTGVNAETGTSSEVTLMYTELPTDKTMLGARISNGNRMYLIHSYPVNKWCYGYGEYISLNSLTLVTDIKYVVKSTLASGEQSIYVNDVAAGTVGTNTTSYDISLNYYLFAMNKGGTADAFSKARLYECIIYSDGTEVRDFIPCTRDSDEEVGLYDIVNDVFYTNSGSGSFTAGDGIEPGVVISAVDTTYTAGTGINIYEDSEGNNVIENTQTSAEWGNITGDISDQTDLQDALDTKQDILTAGDGITIEEDSTGANIISSVVINFIDYTDESSEEG